MAEMSMNEIIHAAVRRDLGRFESALRSFRAGDGARARQLRRAWATIERQLTHHHESEDAHVWPYVRSLGVVGPTVLEEMVSEHEDMSRGLASVSAALDALVAAPTTERAGSAADAVAGTAGVTIRHLDHEERDIMPVVMEREHTPEWKAVEKQLRKGSPSHAGELFAWLQDGGDPKALDALTRTVPAPVRFVLSRGFGRSYHREVAPVWR